jgi:tRNA(Ile)-lysidine synthase
VPARTSPQAAVTAGAPRRPRLHPAVASVRLAVRRCLANVPAGSLVLVACSGGPDSLALAAATAFEAPRLGLRAGAVTVDHGLQPGSAEHAGRVAGVLRELGFDPVHVVAVDVAGRAAEGAPGAYPGPEAAARQARYIALDQVADSSGAAVLLLGHTLDDQAETVLLGLARGSGARSLAGMAPASGRYLRPLLGVRRVQTSAACAALGLGAWDDPQNADPAFTRTRVRQRALPALEDSLGPGIAGALARTADLLRADADLLDDLAADAVSRLLRQPEPASGTADTEIAGPVQVEIAGTAELPGALRARVLHRAAIAAGVPPGALTAAHVAEIDALVTDWHGQRWTDLPGRLRCRRHQGWLVFSAR